MDANVMDAMFSLSAPWWHFVLRACCVYVFVLALFRLAGKRSVGEFTPFDLVVVILIGEAMQGALVAGEESVLAPAISAATLVALNYLVGFLSTRWALFDQLVAGKPVVLVRDGKVCRRAMRSENVPHSDLQEALRRAGLHVLDQVRLATLETDGEITVVARDDDPPASSQAP